MMEKNLSKFVEAAARECYYLNINGNLVKEICLIILDQSKIDLLSITDQITEKYQYLFYHNCFSDLVTLTSLASIDHHFLLRKIPIYNFVIASSFRVRNFINEKNHVFIDENIFNYFINILNQDIDNIKLGNIDTIYDYMPKSDDEFFHTYLKTIDYFICTHQISVPKKVMDGYYKDESRHYKKIKHLLI